MHYRVHSTQVKCLRWYPTKAQAIAAFESKCKRIGIAPPECYQPGVSGDSITTNDLTYPRRTSARGVRDGHGWVYVEPATIDWGGLEGRCVSREHPCAFDSHRVREQNPYTRL